MASAARRGRLRVAERALLAPALLDQVALFRLAGGIEQILVFRFTMRKISDAPSAGSL